MVPNRIKKIRKKVRPKFPFLKDIWEIFVISLQIT